MPVLSVDEGKTYIRRTPVSELLPHGHAGSRALVRRNIFAPDDVLRSENSGRKGPFALRRNDPPARSRRCPDGLLEYGPANARITEI